MNLTNAVPVQIGARPGQIAQPADRLAAGPTTPATARARPGRPATPRRDVGLAARPVVGVPGVDQHHGHRVFEQVVERLPVVAGGLHHHTRDLLGDQVFAQRQDLVAHRTPGRHARRCRSSPRALNPDAHLGVLLRDVDTRTPPMHHFHPDHLSRSSTKTIVGVRIAGRRVSNRTFLHVLEATIHGSRKRTRDRPTSTTTFPNGLAAPKENRGRPRHAPTDRALPGHRSKARSARDFPLHGGREASCTVPKKGGTHQTRDGSFTRLENDDI